MTPEQARRVALYVSAAFSPPLSETSQALWADAIVDLDPTLAQRAAKLMVQEVPAFPSVAHLRERYDRLARQPPEHQPALTFRPAPPTVEERRSSPGLKALGDVAATLKKRMRAG